MAVRIQDFFRDAASGDGIAGRTVSLRKVVGGSEIATVSTDANGKIVFDDSDVDFSDGPVYYIVDDGSGTYKRHSGQSFGRVGPVWFDAVVRALTAFGKGAISGLEVTADGGGLDVSLGAGVAMCKDGIPVYWDAAQELSIATADGTHPRIDLVVLRTTRVGQTEEGKVVPTVITGTPAGSPTAPTPTANSSTDDLVLAEVLVEASASVITSDKVTDRRTITGQAVLSVPLQGGVIDDEAIGTNHLVDEAVTTAKIDDGAVTNAKLGTAIDATKIANGAVNNTEFQFLSGVSGDVQNQINDRVLTTTYTAGLAGKSNTSHTHTQPATLSGKAFQVHSTVDTVNTSNVDIVNFNLGPLVSGVTYDVVAHGSGQANAASGGTITAYIRIENGDTPEAGYGTATVGGERQIEAFHSREIVGTGATINISFRAQSTNNGASVNGAMVWAMAIPRNVPAS